MTLKNHSSSHSMTTTVVSPSHLYKFPGREQIKMREDLMFLLFNLRSTTRHHHEMFNSFHDENATRVTISLRCFIKDNITQKTEIHYE